MKKILSKNDIKKALGINSLIAYENDDQKINELQDRELMEERMKDARNWLLFLSVLTMLFLINSMKDLKSDRHFYISLTHFLGSILNMCLASKKVRWRINLAFIYMMVRLPFR